MASQSDPGSLISSLLTDLDKLRAVVGRVRTTQIQSAEVRGHIKAVATAWFRTYRPASVGRDVGNLNTRFEALLVAAEKSPSTQKVRKQLRALRQEIVALQTQVIASPLAAVPTPDSAPSFSAIPDPLMKQVLMRRWDECVACLSASAPMAATVMMGGLLESLFLARVNREANKAPIFKAQAAPKDKQGHPQPLNRWMLGNYIAVAHELGWITQSARDVSEVLQEYRNYIHPHKELSLQAALTPDDARILWAVFKAIAIRLI